MSLWIPISPSYSLSVTPFPQRLLQLYLNFFNIKMLKLSNCFSLFTLQHLWNLKLLNAKGCLIVFAQIILQTLTSLTEANISTVVFRHINIILLSNLRCKCLNKTLSNPFLRMTWHYPCIKYSQTFQRDSPRMLAWPISINATIHRTPNKNISFDVPLLQLLFHRGGRRT